MDYNRRLNFDYFLLIYLFAILFYDYRKYRRQQKIETHAFWKLKVS